MRPTFDNARARARAWLGVALAGLLLAAAGYAQAESRTTSSRQTTSSETTYKEGTSGSTSTSSLSVSPTALTVTVGGTASISVSGASGTVSAVSANPSSTATATNPAIADVTSVGSTSVKIAGRSAGYTVITVSDRTSRKYVTVTVVTSAATSSNRYNVLAWNDLGMHCMDGRDYSVFSILPPYNNLIGQLVDRFSWTGPVAPSTLTGSTVLTNAYLTYETVADAQLKSINTYSGGVNKTTKTNFWQYVKLLYGVQPPDDCGITAARNHTPSLTPYKMGFNAGLAWFEAIGIPITPLSESVASPSTLVTNEYPPVKVSARNSSGTLLASTVTVLPVSSEITCQSCHAPNSPTSTNTNPASKNYRKAAKPDAGWISDGDPEKAWKYNILKRHDELSGTTLYVDATQNGKPALCSGCHGSNVLNLQPSGGATWLTASLHGDHAYVTDPSTTGPLTLNDETNRSACYSCHPGSTTQCLRGAMSNVSGVECQSCHGSMAKVGDPARVGWLQEPTCQACHYNAQRSRTALDASGNLVKPADLTFATNANVPVAGANLYRYSSGHGGMKCESCHGATHAEYPTTQPNDNLQSVALQGYKGTVRECLVCHSTPPQDSKLSQGPHGMHWIGQTWVSKHGDLAEGKLASCAYCHVANYASYVANNQTPPSSAYTGSPLSEVKAPRSFRVGDSGSVKSFATGHQVSCYDCHNGPSGG